MAYTASRRPSVLGRLGSWVATGLAGAVIWWFVFFGLRPALIHDGFAVVAAAFAGWLIVGIVAHECGHLVVGLALGEPVRKLRIGTGPTLVGFRVRGLTVQLCLNPITGGAVYFSRINSVSRGAHLASLAAGPGVNLLAAAYGFVLFQSGVEWLAPLVLANIVLFVGSATPATSTRGGQRHRSDGMQILELLLRPQTLNTGYEGAELTEDAYAMLARAGEDAQLAGAAEVTDQDLLRALNRDAALGRLFASVGLQSRIPPAAMAESDVVTMPRISKVVHDALTATIRTCRDMGIARPNAAGFCLGLLLVDCPAGRMMREAGITEQAVLKLMTAGPADDEDLRRTRVITPDVPLERWGTAADAVLAQAIRIAVADGASQVGTEHLVAAVVASPDCRGALALQRLGFGLGWRKATPDGDDDPAADGVPVLSPQCGVALAGALWRTGPNHPAGTAEIVLGIVDQTVGVGAHLLLSTGITSRALENALRLTPRESSEPAACTESSRGLWMLRGSARVGAQRWLDARSDFLAAEKVATTDPQRALCNNNIAWVSLMSADPGLAAEALERSRAALAVQPDQIAFLGTHAFALLENGSPVEAAELLERVIPRQGRPRNRASDLCLLALCRARLGDADLAAQHAAEAAAADPRCPLLGRAGAEVERASTPGALSSLHGR
ncbi:MAG TPA: site-2 protease family protein [Candidatus Limnocylindrales bacterium]|nr:site-2 protease family protein [Candidatus Limnocylindrales bacterium]